MGAAFEKALQAIDPKDAQRMRNNWIAITIKQVTDYILLWQAIILAVLLLSVFWYWNRRLVQVNLKISSTLSGLNLVQARLERQNQKLKKIDN